MDLISLNKFTFVGQFWPDCQERYDNLHRFLEHWKSAPVSIRILASNQERSTIINRLADDITTPYMAIVDIDGILDQSVLDDVQKAFDDGADVVYPYSKIWDTGGWFWKDKYTYGIMVFFKTNSFWKMGGEDETFVGWGWEDFERYYRALNHDFKVVRLDGTITHHHHPRQEVGIKKAKHNMSIMLKQKKLYESRHGINPTSNE